MSEQAPVREYARTHSATTKHVINPDKRERTLCGHVVRLEFAGCLPHSRDYTYGLDTCGKCERSAQRRGLVEGPEIYREYAPRIIRYVERFRGTACIKNVDYPSTVCGYGVGDEAGRDRDDVAHLRPCRECRTRASDDGYMTPEEYAAAEQAAEPLDLAALTPGTVVVPKTGTRYALIEFLPRHPDGDHLAYWWAEPVDGGRRMRLGGADFAFYGWTIEQPPAEQGQDDAAPAVITWAMTRCNGGVRHVVDPRAQLDEGEAGQRTLCGAGAWYTTPSTKLDPWSPWEQAVGCSRCTDAAKARGMITQVEADARAQQAETVTVHVMKADGGPWFAVEVESLREAAQPIGWGVETTSPTSFLRLQGPAPDAPAEAAAARGREIVHELIAQAHITHPVRVRE
ncbi:hypothetical protein JOL79_06785 [Microbispora sp. RL4-1S]|uniref:Uncharacterized protein n=1 Tax=Microbispora oryzae TaxID=2806554 RepID=A0A940WIP2_9ACTN|nr:hypothetical protein [Microbispora oryzae]MBP2703503.1 hypothetical protein [Microbispora oryzae]